MPFALKSVKQSIDVSTFPPELLGLMQDYKSMVNDCVRIGMEDDVSSMKRLSLFSYGILRHRYASLPSCYRLTAISKAAGILASRKKSIKRGILTKDPYLRKPLLVSCYNFRIVEDELCFNVTKHHRIRIPLTSHTVREIRKNGIEVRSFTINPSSLSLSFRKEIAPYTPKCFFGIDRNASNVSCGNSVSVIQFGTEKVSEIARTTRQIVRSFKRNDVRIRKVLTTKYGRRRSERVKQILHKISKEIVDFARVNQSAVVFENNRSID